MITAYIFLASFTLSLKAFGFYSPTAMEAQVTFQHSFTVAGELGAGDAAYEVQQLLPYLTGPLQTTTPKAGPKFDFQVSDLRFHVHTMTSGSQVTQIQFKARGTFIVQTESAERFALYLPVDRRQIFTQAQVPDRGDERDPRRFPCVDQFHLAEKYFWYFWSPFREDCPLREGQHYLRIQPETVTPLPSSGGATRPRFEEMVRAGSITRMLLVFGADQDVLGALPPDSSNPDHNRQSHNEVRNRLRRLGFQSRTLPHADLAQECGGRSLPQNFLIEEFRHTINGHEFAVRLFWGVTSPGPQSLGFYCQLDRATADSSIIVYNGHSGLGSSAYLGDLRRDHGLPFRFGNSLSQLIAFNGCSSYGYFNLDFFREKSTPADPTGSRYLDVITNGIAGDFYDLGKMTLALVEPFFRFAADGSLSTYAEMIDAMGMRGDYLTAVNGDLDNPRVSHPR